MRKYSVLEYPHRQREYFKFLIEDYNFIIQEEPYNYPSYVTIYKKGNIWLDVNYDIRDNFFYFKICRGKNIEKPDSRVTFLDVFAEAEPGIDLKQFEPDDDQYLKSLELNAIYLKKYGDKILKGEHWPSQISK